MSKPVEVHPQVEFDIDEEVAYLSDHGPSEVVNFVLAVEAALEGIALAPLEKAPWLAEGLPPHVRWAPIGKFKAKAVFVTQPRLIVLAVRGHAQHPTRWLDRFDEL